MKQTAVEFLIQQLWSPCRGIPSDIIEQAQQIEKEQMIKFAEFVATYQDKNRNHLNQTLHSKSKYDEAERTIDLLERYYNQTL